MDTDFDVARPLGVVEDFFWLFDHSCPKHFCIVAEIKGRTLVTDWKAAAAALQARHPMLFVSIDCTRQRIPHFYKGSRRPIPLRVAPSGTTWGREAEREISSPFDPTEGPLARGLSSISLLRDLLSAISGQQLDPYEFPPPID
ncbi:MULTISPECIES: hypothetical protein [unclassified Rhizobium]|uniref:hypothetical protein n=1 Tax=unclassified Rhizobium TaxID=2613769 RepID=UPI001ADA1AA1|nr:MULTISPECIES: hypothetical protein [unclassified Rhizobium]MBO9101261.1 hypothetical protein [Rhizobium sp. L58/93]MBO9171820.1 hypothetical protein [Rhizobium sp. L245/93]MBO9182701.1 hypothetical protein [Rhizobium sp. E27B/91]QXZ86440.1 hypothetical protein J5287_25760 [Rhizobium sp. K1/93]QXZ92105.1 hypothetical protein J5280_23425 [Rhizobium sp. K15/93]